MTYILRCGTKVLDLSRPRIMAILNVTPDSFSDGGLDYRGSAFDAARAVARARALVADGADIIDVGGESTRPGAAMVSAQEEMDRVLPVVEALCSDGSAIVSVDTSCPEVMREAIRLGAGIINDVRALQRHGAIDAVTASGVAVCLMHMQGEPGTMQQAPQYVDAVKDVGEFLLARAQTCIDAGIESSRIVIDPGFGFGKTLHHNFQLLAKLRLFQSLGFPLLVGMSRKSMIGEVTARAVTDRLAGSLACAVLAVERGANILRVHDVAQTRDVLLMTQSVLKDDGA